jgi:hypothetical protein
MMNENLPKDFISVGLHGKVAEKLIDHEEGRGINSDLNVGIGTTCKTTPCT